MGYKGVNLIRLAQNRGQQWAFLNAVMTPASMKGEFLASL
jgi:hypothetical protein